MKNFLQDIKIKIRGGSLRFPEFKFVAPIFYSILILFTGFGLANTVYTYLKNNNLNNFSISTEKGPRQQREAQNFSLKNFEPILTRNIFNIEGTLPDQGNDGAQFCKTEPKKSTLAYRVSGIIYGGEAKSSIVLLEQNTNSSNLILTLGDTLLPGIKISDISKDKVYLKGKGCPEYLEINYPAPPLQRGSILQKKSNLAYSENGFERIGNTTTVTKQWVNDVLSNKLSAALEDARAVPYLVGGQVKGFKLTQIVPDSVYAKLGLKNDDIVSNINGIELNDAARAIQTLNSLRSETKIQLDVLRDGQPVNLKVDIQ